MDYPDIDGALEAFHDDVGIFAKLEPITCWRLTVRETWPLPWSSSETSIHEKQEEAVKKAQEFLDTIPATGTPEYEALVKKALVSDVSPPRLFVDSRKDFSWRRSTPIHEAKCR